MSEEANVISVGGYSITLAQLVYGLKVGGSTLQVSPSGIDHAIGEFAAQLGDAIEGGSFANLQVGEALLHIGLGYGIYAALAESPFSIALVEAAVPIVEGVLGLVLAPEIAGITVDYGDTPLNYKYYGDTALNYKQLNLR